MKDKKKKVHFWDIILLVIGMIKIAFNPNDISPIFRARSFRNHKSIQLALETFYEDQNTSQLIKNRYLSDKPYNLDELLKLPKNTLGYEFANHMTKHKLEVVFYPELEDKEEDDIAYLRKRARQTHDIHHVLLNFPAIDVGEAAISAFYLAQHRIPLSGLLIGVGFFNAVIKQPHRIEELMNSVISGWTMGKKAKKVLGVKWEEYWDKPIDEVRKELNIDIELSPFNNNHELLALV